MRRLDLRRCRFVPILLTLTLLAGITGRRVSVRADDNASAVRPDPFAAPAPEGARSLIRRSWIRPRRPYARKPDAPLDAKEQQIEHAEHYDIYRVEFNGIEGDRVPSRLYLPSAGRGRFPAVLLQYGSGGRKETDYIVRIGRLFAEAGFVVLTIDSPGRGERRKPRDQEPALGQVGRPRFVQYLGDYARAVDYLCSRRDVDDKRIGYVGISWGAITGIVYAAHDARVRVVVSLVGGGRFLGLLGGVGNSVAARRRSLDPVDHVPLIAPRPLLLINVKRDQLVRRPFGEALQEAAGPGAKKMWLDTDHFFRGVDVPKLVKETVIAFVRDGLKAEAGQSGTP